MCGGIWFQILGPQTEKARFPNWDRVRTTKAALVVEERSWRRPEYSVTVNIQNLYSVCNFTGTQTSCCMDKLGKVHQEKDQEKLICNTKNTVVHKWDNIRFRETGVRQKQLELYYTEVGLLVHINYLFTAKALSQ